MRLEAALKRYAEEVETPEAELEEVHLEGDLEGLDALDETDLKALSKLPHLVALSLAENGLKKVHANFPPLQKLVSLDLRSNDFGSDILGTLSRLSSLSILMLTDNSIKTLDKFTNLKPLSKLEYLGLEGCPVTETHPDYRDKLFALLPQLQVIDFIHRDGTKLERPAAESSEEDADLNEFYNKDFDDEESDEDYESSSSEESPLSKKPKRE